MPDEKGGIALSDDSYMEQALENMRFGAKFEVRHEGQTKNHYVTFIDGNRWLVTSTRRGDKAIFTHMVVKEEYLRRHGITLKR